MKIILNANVTAKTIDTYLDEQKQKSDKIKAFCVKHNIDELTYKDSSLEYEYKAQPKVETRPKVANKETRAGG